MASGVAAISGQAAVISSRVKISLLLLRASSDNLESCSIILLQGSGRSVRLVILLDVRGLPNLERCRVMVEQMK